jgi:multidrug efflux pump subunit AcrA (membrane-fusion protein)
MNPTSAKPATSTRVRWAIPLSVLAVVLALGMASPRAHAHADPAPTAASAAPLEPRVEASSSDVEMIARVEGGRLAVYVARFATLEPLAGATVTVEGGGRSASGTTDVLGLVRLELPWLAAPGQYPLLFTVAAGEVNDLLTATLDIPPPEAGDVAPVWRVLLAPTAVGGAAVGIVFGLVLGVLATWAIGRRRRHARAGRAAHAGLVVLVVPGLAAALLASIGWVPSAQAHDSMPAKAAASSRSPVRLADGSVLVPVLAQRVLGLRTVEAAPAIVGVPVELAGTVLVDPSASGRVQAPVAGRIEPGPRGLPTPGMTVSRGETLAWLVPTVTPLERGTQQAQIADLETQIEVARARVARYDQLEGSLPQRDIDQARTDLAGLERRRSALAAPMGARVALTAPVRGVVSTVAIASGQMVDARDLLVQISDPTRLLVEALAYDARLAKAIAEASAVTADGTAVKLLPLGAAGELRQQALPLLFRVAGSAALAIGQPVRVIVQTSRSASGYVLPAASIVRTGNGEPVVWVKTGGERFDPRRVEARALDAGRVVATGGLAEGDRVVVIGASLLSQVR